MIIKKLYTKILIRCCHCLFLLSTRMPVCTKINDENTVLLDSCVCVCDIIENLFWNIEFEEFLWMINFFLQMICWFIRIKKNELITSHCTFCTIQKSLATYSCVFFFFNETKTENQNGIPVQDETKFWWIQTKGEGKDSWKESETIVNI